jgi:hypothetical protein
MNHFPYIQKLLFDSIPEVTLVIIPDEEDGNFRANIVRRDNPRLIVNVGEWRGSVYQAIYQLETQLEAEDRQRLKKPKAYPSYETCPHILGSRKTGQTHQCVLQAGHSGHHEVYSAVKHSVAHLATGVLTVGDEVFATLDVRTSDVIRKGAAVYFKPKPKAYCGHTWICPQFMHAHTCTLEKDHAQAHQDMNSTMLHQLHIERTQ